MSGKDYSITITLDTNGLPDESALIENLILNNTLGQFLYTVANDIIEGRYNLEAGSTRIMINQLIETVGSIFSTVGSMSGNIEDIVSVLNDHTDLLGNMRHAPIQPQTVAEQASSIDDDEPLLLDLGEPSADAEDLFAVISTEVEGGDLIISNELEDLFDFDGINS